jgi:outer membrane biosynthesis protein TonB
VDSAGQTVAPRKGSFSLGRALGVSILLHLILGVISFWTPMLNAKVIPANPDEGLLQFTFAPRDDDTEATDSARGEVPFETRPQPEQRQLVQPSQESAGLPDIPLPPNPTPPDPLEQPQPEQQLEERLDPDELARPEEDPDDPTPEETDKPVEETGTELEQTDASPFRSGVDNPAQRTAPKEPNTGRDLNSALRSFQRAIDLSRAARPEQPPGSGTQQNVYVPDMSSVPVQGAPYGILEFSSRDYDWSEYSSQIYWAILKAWYKRLYLTTSDFEKWAHSNQQFFLNHKSRIQFVIEASGDVTGITLNVGSGCDPLDQSALDALSEVILPPLPADFPRSHEVVNATFVATGEIMSMRPMFRYLNQIGYF